MAARLLLHHVTTSGNITDVIMRYLVRYTHKHGFGPSVFLPALAGPSFSSQLALMPERPFDLASRAITLHNAFQDPTACEDRQIVYRDQHHCSSVETIQGTRLDLCPRTPQGDHHVTDFDGHHGSCHSHFPGRGF